jgi:uncharacterized protein YhfF
MFRQADINGCWDSYLRSLPVDAQAPTEYFDASAFGAEGEHHLADELAELVVQGIKTATSSVLSYYQEGNHPLEQVGDRCIVLMSTGQPRCIIEMTEIRILPFGEVDEAFAADYGEGVRTLQWWKEHLGAYYARECATRGWTFSAEMPLVCKRFHLIFHCPAVTAKTANPIGQ